MAKSGYRVTLGDDPKFYPATDERQPFAFVSLAEDSWSYDAETQQFERGKTTWYQGTFFGKDAEALASTFQKGDRILVLGRVSENIVQKDGREFKNLSLRADTFGPDMTYADVTINRGPRAAAQQSQTMNQEQQSLPNLQSMMAGSPDVQQPGDMSGQPTPESSPQQDSTGQREFQQHAESVMAPPASSTSASWADSQVDEFYAEQSNEQLASRVQQYGY